MADTKVTALTENTTPLTTDIIPMVDDPAGTPLSQKIKLSNVIALAVSDTAYASSWNGVTTIAPSKNAVFDILNDVQVTRGKVVAMMALNVNL